MFKLQLRENGVSSFYSFLIEIQFIYNILLVLGVQKGDSVIHISIYLFFFKFCLITGYYTILSTAPCAAQRVRIDVFYI